MFRSNIAHISLTAVPNNELIHSIVFSFFSLFIGCEVVFEEMEIKLEDMVEAVQGKQDF